MDSLGLTCTSVTTSGIDATQGLTVTNSLCVSEQLNDTVKEESWWSSGPRFPLPRPWSTPTPPTSLPSTICFSWGCWRLFPTLNAGLPTPGNGSYILVRLRNVCKPTDHQDVGEISRESNRILAHLLCTLGSEIQHRPSIFPTQDAFSDVWDIFPRDGGQTLPSPSFPGFSKVLIILPPSDLGDCVETESHITCYGITEFLR